MNVRIQSVKFDAKDHLIEFINTKLGKLERFTDAAVSAEVFLKLDKDNEHGDKLVTVRLEVPGGDLVAEHRSRSFEESVDECVDAIKKQLERHKERYNK